MKKILGAIELNTITDLSKLPQKAASAAAFLETNDLIGAEYKPLIFIGEQVVRGINYCFIAEQTLMTENFDKHIVTIAVNDFNGELEIVKSSIIEII